ncbi:MAG: FAD-binding oxidoreductase, partial [Nitrosospira sp.]|nr:FAD-binding oxidoreductase [Nitrosospira sp.]
DSFRLLRAYAPTFVKNFGEVQVRFNSQFFKALRTSKHWVKDEITPFEKVRMLEPKPLSRFNKESVRNAAAAFPAFEHARITHEWSCFMDVTPDAVPLIGPVEKLPGLYLATGFSGHGFGLGPGAGELVADIVSNDSPCVDPSPFSPQRFDR